MIYKEAMEVSRAKRRMENGQLSPSRARATSDLIGGKLNEMFTL